MPKQKFYVVWDGVDDGVYTSWEACKEAVHGYSYAKYKAFSTENEAEAAYAMGYEKWKEQERDKAPDNMAGVSSDKRREATQDNTPDKTAIPAYTLPEEAIKDSLVVDAACSGNPGMMEYRGLYLRTGKELFHFGPVYGTNNIGEFLAIVHGLALLNKHGLTDAPIYSDSVNAQLWGRKRKCKTKLERNEKTEQLFLIIERAEKWLRENKYKNPVIKWPTDKWGEIPADFGRK